MLLAAIDCEQASREVATAGKLFTTPQKEIRLPEAYSGLPKHVFLLMEPVALGQLSKR